MVRVFNLATQQELFYWCAPAMAVVAAYAQERKDFNTWMYYKYWELLEYSPRVVTCGDWSAIHSGACPECGERYTLSGICMNCAGEVISPYR